MTDHTYRSSDAPALTISRTVLPCVMSGRLLSVLLVLVSVVCVGCSGDSDVVRSEPDGAAVISIVSGDNQTGRGGDRLAESVVVSVTDTAQVPIADVGVLFAIIDGGGAVSHATVNTDDDGLAGTGWTIGIGPNALEVSLVDSSYEVSPCPVRATSDCPYHPPESLDDGLDVASVNASGMDLGRLHDALNLAYSDDYGFLNSLLILKDGYLVIEEYPGSSRNELQIVASITKSFTSAMIGIAIEEGLITGTDERLFDFFPEYAHLRSDSKDSILLWHVLAMASGFECNELEIPYTDPQNDVNQATQSGNWIEYVLSKPMTDRPGARWNYNSGNSMLLGGILYNTSGVHADIFCLGHIFHPLGITAYEWSYQADGLPYTGGSLRLRSRDLMKFGLLYLQGGVWDGAQIVPQAWVDVSTVNHVPEEMYGYQWWIGSIYGYDFYIAVGYGGQRIINIPDLDMIIVHTSDLTTIADLSTRLDLLNDIVREIIQAGAGDQPVRGADTEGFVPHSGLGDPISAPTR